MTRRPLSVIDSGAELEAGPDDPVSLVGVAVRVDEATFDEMGRCLIEEYVREGWSDEALEGLFRSPFYAGAHVIWRTRGSAWVADEIAAARRRWQRPNPADDAAAGPQGVA